MPIAILCIGTEITRGEIVNTNASWLAEQVTALGLEVIANDVVPDEPERIAATLERLSAECDAIVCTGGLGPTTDDLTAASVGRLLGSPLERDAVSLERIRERLAKYGRALAESNAKQAHLPRGAVAIPNDWGTAPGFAVTIGKARAYFLPGVPREMKPMFERTVLPELASKSDARAHQIRLQTFGKPEAEVNDLLAGVEAAHDVIVGYRAHFPDIELKFLARGGDDPPGRARAAADDAKRRLGAIVYGEGSIALPEAVGALLRERKLRLGTAESCTGGLVGALLTEAPGSSDFFRGAIVAYSNDVKTKLLDVRAETLAAHGAVSEETAREMASGALGALDVDIALSITGVAGPTGGTAEKPVGLVHFAVATRSAVVARKMSYPAPRDLVRRLAAFRGLALVREILLAESNS